MPHTRIRRRGGRDEFRGLAPATGSSHPRRHIAANGRHYPDETTKWRSLRPPPLQDESSDNFSGPLPTVYHPHGEHSRTGGFGKPESARPRRDARTGRATAAPATVSTAAPVSKNQSQQPHKSLNPLHSHLLDDLDQRSMNKLMVLCQTPRAVAGIMAVIQYGIRLLHIHRPGQNFHFSKSRGISLDLDQVQNTFSTFRNLTSMGQILGIYTSQQSRIAAQRGDKLTRSLDFLQLAAVLYSVIFKALGWVSRRNILNLSHDSAKHKRRLNFIDKSGARVWAGTMVFDFIKMGREVYSERREKRRQEERIASGNFDRAKEEAITAARNSPEAVKARRKRLRHALINVAYIPVAIGFSIPNSVSWQNIVIATLCAHSLKARGYFMDAVRAAKALRH